MVQQKPQTSSPQAARAPRPPPLAAWAAAVGPGGREAWRARLGPWEGWRDHCPGDGLGKGVISVLNA